MPIVGWLAGLVACGGVIIATWGLWPRRRGTTPLCRHCGYDLTGHAGSANPRCSECGADLSDALAIVHGHRYRRWGWGIAGVWLAALGLVPLIAVATGAVALYNWYQHAPTAWVIGDAADPNSGRTQEAYRELRRRFNTGALSPADTSRVVDLCIKEMGRTTARVPPLPRARYLIDQLVLADVLTPAQLERVCENLPILECEYRPRVVVGDPVPVRVIGHVRHLYNVLRCRVMFRTARIGTAPPQRFAGELPTGTGDARIMLSAPAPGKQPIEVVVDIEVLDARPGPRAAAMPTLHTARRTLRGAVEVLATQPADLIVARHSPESDAYYGAVRLGGVRAERQPSGDNATVPGAAPDVRLAVRLDLPQGRPQGGAFEIWLRAGDSAWRRLGPFTPLASDAWGTHWPEYVLPGPVPPVVDILVRSDPDVARQTTYLYEIWDGEILFERVPVVEVQAPPVTHSVEGEVPLEIPQPSPGITGVVRRRTPNELMPGDE